MEGSGLKRVVVDKESHLSPFAFYLQGLATRLPAREAGVFVKLPIAAGVGKEIEIAQAIGSHFLYGFFKKCATQAQATAFLVNGKETQFAVVVPFAS